VRRYGGRGGRDRLIMSSISVTPPGRGAGDCEDSVDKNAFKNYLTTVIYMVHC
jgi:hypothetical protein